MEVLFLIIHKRECPKNFDPEKFKMILQLYDNQTPMEIMLLYKRTQKYCRIAY